MSAWPVELRLDRSKTTLTVTFDSGDSFTLPAEYLRVESPSAEVQGHEPGQKLILGGKQAVTMTALEPVGNYAVRILFDDGHDTGLYSWSYLHELGRDHGKRWNNYLQQIKSRGLQR